MSEDVQDGKVYIFAVRSTTTPSAMQVHVEGTACRRAHAGKAAMAAKRHVCWLNWKAIQAQRGAAELHGPQAPAAPRCPAPSAVLRPEQRPVGT